MNLEGKRSAEPQVESVPANGSVDVTEGETVTDSPERTIDPVETLRTSVRQFVRCIEMLPDDLWPTKIVNWTPRDVVAHLIGWNAYMIEGCELMRVGKTPAYLNDHEDDYRHVNAASVQRYPALDRRTLITELDASFRKLEQYLARLDLGAWDADTSIRLSGRPVTIRNSIRALGRDYHNHRQRIEQWQSGLRASDRQAADKQPPSSLTVMGITHVGLKVSDAAGSRKFYREILGLDGEPRASGIVYVPAGQDVLILYEERSGATDFHFGFNMQSPSIVDQWEDWLKRHDIAISESVSEEKYRSIKFQDPDGHWIEIFYEE